jgi:hypothetical protein
MESIIEIPDEIYYLVHITTKSNYKDSDGNFLWKQLNPAPVDNGTDQFPGVYFSLITKDNILTENIFPGKFCLIFSRNLLKQFNYHINVGDNNGFITENNTYFPWNLKDAVEKIKENSKIPPSETDFSYHLMNEVIFHDAVPMEYCCLNFEKSSTVRESGANRFLPDYHIENDVKPNMSLLPFYCYAPKEEINRLNSSDFFFKNMAKFCNVDSKLLKDEIIEKIQEKIKYLYSNRNEQNIEMLKKIYKDLYEYNKKK